MINYISYVGILSLAQTKRRYNSKKIKTNASMIRKRRQRQPYNQVETNQRQVLLDLVQRDGLIIKEAARQLDIKYSTAKTILQLWKRTGRIEKID
jgi:DNA-binding MarR family transcriptional regulator